jgi:hypothetical protein
VIASRDRLGLWDAFTRFPGDGRERCAAALLEQPDGQAAPGLAEHQAISFHAVPA